ncbi:carbohydrate binding domain-containing protein [Paenibacillus sp. LHD-117]|uniref:carbohydrate binding domain-containing protein n=1 Tax=Paenibacillus sp. LHD-117 TaxID=3071412 RepID=UPI0027DFAA1A|nr:carbohydrate binding domain-containing protein [Paenibacillus sp. LHD-117]MDQ6423513.1 carbohydrate binding domain-containing protein [Paenibacillus sp. LHD-117]
MLLKKSLNALLLFALLSTLLTNGLLYTPQTAQAASIGTIDENDTIYQIMVDRFHDGNPSNNATGAAIRYGESSEEDFRHMKGGDWQGVIDKLSYIKNMGYTAIWISPVAEPQMTNRVNNGTGRNTAYHGYNVKDPNKANPYFGTKEKLKELVDAAHAQGIKVIIDVVPNHIGDYMLGSQAYYDIPELQPAAPFNNPAWYHHNGDIDWSLTDGRYDQWAQNYLENHDLAGLDDLDFDVPAARQAMFDSIKGWFDYTGADGARVDAAKLMHPSDIGALEDYIGVNTFGENFDGNPEFVSRWLGNGKEWGMLDFPLFFSVLNSFAYGQSFDSSIKSTLAQDSVYNGNENHMVTFIDNHDRNRFLQEAGGSVEKLQNALSFIFTVRGMPVVFQGTEQNKGNGNNQIITGGIADTWNRWSMVKRDSNGNVLENYFNENTNTYQHIAKLNQIRKNYEALRKGKQREMWSAQNLYAFSRRVDSGANAGQEVISVFSNASSSSQTVTIPLRTESTLPVGTVLVNQLNPSESVTVQSGGITGKQITVAVSANSSKIYAKALSDTTAPSVPANVSAQAQSTSSITVSWTASTDNIGVTGYEVYRGGTLVGTPVGTSFTDQNLAANTSYTYTVKAVDAAGNRSAASSPATAVTLALDTQAPTVPQNVSATSSSAGTALVSWTASTDNVGVTGYEVFRGGTLVGTTASTSYTDSGLAGSTSYSYTIKAYDAAGNRSDPSDPPATVTTPAGNSVTIYYKKGFATPYIHYRPVGGTWTTAPGVAMPASEASGYNKITINIGSASQLEACFNNGSGQWDSNNSQNYLFGTGTWTYTPTGNIVAGAPVVIPPDTEPPSVPQSVAATATAAGSATVTWTASTDNVAVTGYEVFRDGNLVGTTAANAASFADTGLASSTAYSYTVKAYDSAGNRSAESAPASVSTPAGNSVKIYYKNSAFANSYIHYKVGTSTTWTTLPGAAMQTDAAYPGYKSITIQLGSATGITAAFNNGSGQWDNNNGNNYTIGSGTWTLVNGSLVSGVPQPDSVTFRVSVPASTPANGPVYLSGSFNGWAPADAAYQMVKGADGVYTLTLPLTAGTAVQYKVTRGTWATVETNANGSDISNRQLTPSGGAQTVHITVQRWKDQ